LIENNSIHLSADEVDDLLTRQPGKKYATFIEDTFSGIYYTDEENRCLDLVVQNIASMRDTYKHTTRYSRHVWSSARSIFSIARIRIFVQVCKMDGYSYVLSKRQTAETLSIGV